MIRISYRPVLAEDPMRTVGGVALTPDASLRAEHEDEHCDIS